MNQKILVFFLVSLGIASGVQAQSSLYNFTGEVPGDLLGRSVAGLKDINQDGVGEIIVAARSAAGPSNTRPGQVYVYSGADGNLLWNFVGDELNDRFGVAAEDAGDVNGDGFPDIIVGARDHSAGGNNAGRATIYSGKTGNIIHVFTGNPNEHLGYSVAGVGDLDQDGFDDVLIGAYGSNGLPGRAIVYSGATGLEIYSFLGEASGDQFGRAVVNAGDINADGYADLMVGSLANYVYVYSGQDGTVLYIFRGDTPTDYFGVSLAGGTDLNQDGFPELLIGAPQGGNNYVGSVSVFSGKTGQLLNQFVGETTGAYFGSSIACPDVNGDGNADILVGSPTFSLGVDRGWTYAFDGVSGNVLFRLDGENIGDRFGIHVASLGDLNSDGFGDIAIGAYLYGAKAGKAYVLSGDDLFTQAVPNIVSLGQNLELSTRGGNVGSPALMVLVGVNGISQFTPLKYGLLNNQGELKLSSTVPSNFSISQITIRSYSLNTRQKLIESHDQAILFQ